MSRTASSAGKMKRAIGCLGEKGGALCSSRGMWRLPNMLASSATLFAPIHGCAMWTIVCTIACSPWWYAVSRRRERHLHLATLALSVAYSAQRG